MISRIQKEITNNSLSSNKKNLSTSSQNFKKNMLHHKRCSIDFSEKNNSKFKFFPKEKLKNINLLKDTY